MSSDSQESNFSFFFCFSPSTEQFYTNGNCPHWIYSEESHRIRPQIVPQCRFHHSPDKSIPPRSNLATTSPIDSWTGWCLDSLDFGSLNSKLKSCVSNALQPLQSPSSIAERIQFLAVCMWLAIWKRKMEWWNESASKMICDECPRHRNSYFIIADCVVFTITTNCLSSYCDETTSILWSNGWIFSLIASMTCCRSSSDEVPLFSAF